jgi:hypothetical protein
MRERRIRRSRLRDLCELLFKIPGFVFHYRVNLSSQNGHIDKDLQLFVNMPCSKPGVQTSRLAHTGLLQLYSRFGVLRDTTVIVHKT